MTARLWYDGGAFLRLEPRSGGPAFWEERKTNPSFSARFDEVAERDDAWLVLDRQRGLHLELPKAGGTSRLSTDGGGTWRTLYTVTAPDLPR